MGKKSLQVKTQLAMAKPAQEVFEAIVNPEKMSHYFISSGSSRMESGKTVRWVFEDVGAGLDVKVERIEGDRFVSFLWSASGVEALVAEEGTRRFGCLGSGQSESDFAGVAQRDPRRCRKVFADTCRPPSGFNVNRFGQRG